MSREELEAALAEEAARTRAEADESGKSIIYTEPVPPLRRDEFGEEPDGSALADTYIDVGAALDAANGNAGEAGGAACGSAVTSESAEAAGASDNRGYPDDAENGSDEYDSDSSGYDDPEERALAELFGGALPEDIDETGFVEFTGDEDFSAGIHQDAGSAGDGSGGAQGDAAADQSAGGAGTGLGLDGGSKGEELSAEDAAIREKIIERKRANAERNRKLRRRIKIVLITIVAAIALFILSLSSFFTIDLIEVSGNSHFTGEEIRNIGHAAPGRNIIYNFNKEEIQGYLEQNPYIKTAEVKRKFPSTMVISVTEREELWAFNYDNDYLIIDEDGILLKKTRNKPKITMVEGMVVSKIKLGEKVGTTDDRQFKRILKLVGAMKEADMYFVRIDMTKDDVVKAYIYDNLVVKTDYDTLVSNLKNDRLHKVVDKLFDDNIKRGTITFKTDGTASFEPSI